MKLIKNTTAFEEFERISNHNWDKCRELMIYIIDHHKETCFNLYFDREFPNGVDEYEFEDFIFDHQKEIIENI